MVKINISHDQAGHLKIELQTQTGQPLDFVFNQPMGSLSATLSSSPQLTSLIDGYLLPDGIYHISSILSPDGISLTSIVNDDDVHQAPIYNFWSPNTELAIHLMYQISRTDLLHYSIDENNNMIQLPSEPFTTGGTYHVHHVIHSGSLHIPMLIADGTEVNAPSLLQSALHFLNLAPLPPSNLIALFTPYDLYTDAMAAIVDPQLDPTNTLSGAQKSTGWPGCVIS